MTPKDPGDSLRQRESPPQPHVGARPFPARGSVGTEVSLGSSNKTDLPPDCRVLFIWSPGLSMEAPIIERFPNNLGLVVKAPPFPFSIVLQDDVTVDVVVMHDYMCISGNPDGSPLQWTYKP